MYGVVWLNIRTSIMFLILFQAIFRDGRSIYLYDIESKEVKKKGIKNLCSESYFF